MDHVTHHDDNVKVEHPESRGIVLKGKISFLWSHSLDDQDCMPRRHVHSVITLELDATCYVLGQVERAQDCTLRHDTIVVLSLVSASPENRGETIGSIDQRGFRGRERVSPKEISYGTGCQCCDVTL